MLSFYFLSTFCIFSLDKAKFEDELSCDEFRKRKKDKEFQDNDESEIDHRKKAMRMGDLKSPFTVGIVSKSVSKTMKDDSLDYYHNDGRLESLTVAHKGNKKKSYIDQIDDLTIFKIKEIPALKAVNTPKTQKLQWTDDIREGRLVERHIINYDEVHDINLIGKVLVSCLKKK